VHWAPHQPRSPHHRHHRITATREDLAGLPPALVISAQNDVLCDEGEAYAAKLTEAGVKTTSVRYNFITHDFMMLNREREAEATTAAIDQAINALRKALDTST
jgi:acetyl esterase